MSLAVLKLRVGDLVSDRNGTLGKVVGFTVKGALIDWEGASAVDETNNDDLRIQGVVLVEGQ